MNHRSLAHAHVCNVACAVHHCISIARVHFLTTVLHGVDFGMIYSSCHAYLSKFKLSSRAMNGRVGRTGNTLGAFHFETQPCANNVDVSYFEISRKLR